MSEEIKEVEKAVADLEYGIAYSDFCGSSRCSIGKKTAKYLLTVLLEKEKENGC